MIAITRGISPNMADCELVHLERQPLNLELLRAEHATYARTLRDLGCAVVELPPLEEHPDSVFVEDTAIVFDQFALLTRPGAESRRGEVSSVARILGEYRELFWISEPGTLDGGDVLVAGTDVFVGLSSRSNAEAVEQLRFLLGPRGYQVHAVEVQNCLHLKSAATWIGDGQMLVNLEWVDPSAFAGYELVEVDPAEPAAANALRLRQVLIHGASYPRTRSRLEERGHQVVPVDISEIAKAEGAVTCCSLILR